MKNQLCILNDEHPTSPGLKRHLSHVHFHHGIGAADHQYQQISNASWEIIMIKNSDQMIMIEAKIVII